MAADRNYSDSAINETAWRNIHGIISTFDNFRRSYGGVAFDIDPFREFLTKEFAYKLMPGRAKTRLHSRLRRWGATAKKKDLFDFIVIHEEGDDSLGGESLRIIQPKSYISRGEREFIEALQRGDADPDREARPIRDRNPNRDWWFIVGAYWNLCSVVTHRQTIEELIYQAAGYKKDHRRVKGGRIIQLPKRREEAIKAIRKLLSLSNSFMLAEWMQEFIFKAIANSDKEFFEAYSRGIKEDIPESRKDTVKTWLPTVMLWYLGGSEIKPRRKFKELLQQRNMLSPTLHLSDETFRSALANFGLTRR